MLKYGMKWSSIDYWQRQAYQLHRFNGWLPKRFEVVRANDTERAPRDIAHDAIMCAFIAPERMRALLAGVKFS